MGFTVGNALLGGITEADIGSRNEHDAAEKYSEGQMVWRDAGGGTVGLYIANSDIDENTAFVEGTTPDEWTRVSIAGSGAATKTEVETGLVNKVVGAAVLKTYTPAFLEGFLDAVGFVNSGIRMKLNGNLSFDLIGGTLARVNPATHEVETSAVIGAANKTFDYIFQDGTIAAANQTNVDPTLVEDTIGVTSEVVAGNDATYQTFYVNAAGDVKAMYGTFNYAAIGSAVSDYGSESKVIPAILDDYIFIGGILMRKDSVSLTATVFVKQVFASKFGEINLAGSVESSTALFKEPVANVAALQALLVPEDGETRQDLDVLPSITMYTFNTGAAAGLTADDGTTGRWNKASVTSEDREFLSATDVGATTSYSPTIAEIEAALTVHNTTAFFTGTDTNTDVITHSYSIDDSGNATLVYRLADSHDLFGALSEWVDDSGSGELELGPLVANQRGVIYTDSGAAGFRTMTLVAQPADTIDKIVKIKLGIDPTSDHIFLLRSNSTTATSTRGFVAIAVSDGTVTPSITGGATLPVVLKTEVTQHFVTAYVRIPLNSNFDSWNIYASAGSDSAPTVFDNTKTGSTTIYELNLDSEPPIEGAEIDSVTVEFAIADWAVSGGSTYRIRVSAFVHLLPTVSSFTVYEKVGNTYHRIDGSQFYIGSTNDVDLYIDNLPDVRFNGRVVINK